MEKNFFDNIYLLIIIHGFNYDKICLNEPLNLFYGKLIKILTFIFI